jgi:hypothetical protein
MDIVSVPIIPDQPNKEYYPLSALALVKEYTRDSYRAAFEQTPAAFDIGRRAKNWFDSSISLADPEADVTYLVFRASPTNSELFSYQMVTMPAFEAATPNFVPIGAVTDAITQAALKRPAREVPVRALLSNERLVNAFTGPMIQRTDMIPVNQVISWTQEDHDRLVAIARKLGVEIS